MPKEKLKLSYKIKERISGQLDTNMGLIALDEGFDAEPYATGFNFLTGERDLVFEKRS